LIREATTVFALGEHFQELIRCGTLIKVQSASS